MATTKSFARFINEAELGNKKADKIAALQNLSPVAKELVFLCLSPYEVFGTKKFTKPKTYAPHNIGDIDEGQSFRNLLHAMAARKLTGNKARDALTETLSQYTQFTAECLMRVLNKDLKCGIDTSVNKVYPGLIPTFGCMLATKLDNPNDVKYPTIAST
jgi:DNA ligase 1